MLFQVKFRLNVILVSLTIPSLVSLSLTVVPAPPPHPHILREYRLSLYLVESRLRLRECLISLSYNCTEGDGRGFHLIRFGRGGNGGFESNLDSEERLTMRCIRLESSRISNKR
jgi:hypothetical protein